MVSRCCCPFLLIPFEIFLHSCTFVNKLIMRFREVVLVFFLYFKCFDFFPHFSHLELALSESVTQINLLPWLLPKFNESLLSTVFTHLWIHSTLQCLANKALFIGTDPSDLSIFLCFQEFAKTSRKMDSVGSLMMEVYPNRTAYCMILMHNR